MHISNGLPKFENVNALIVVMGAKSVLFYTGSNSTLEELESFYLKEPEYSKNRTMRGVNAEKGKSSLRSAYTSRGPSLLTDFLQGFYKHLVNILKQNVITKIYMFCPTYMEARVRNILPKDIHNKIVAVHRGNFVKKHPFEILKMLEMDHGIEGVVIENNEEEID
ncbi:MAG: hypothetical protein WCO12_00900 [bacterium]